MSPIKLILILAGILALSGCTLSRAEQSWSMQLTETDAANISEVIAALVQDRLETGGKPIAITPSSMNSAASLEKPLTTALVARGYSVVPPDTKQAYKLSYIITEYRKGIVLRIMINSSIASTLLIRGENGALAAATPLAFREEQK